MTMSRSCFVSAWNSSDSFLVSGFALSVDSAEKLRLCFMDEMIEDDDDARVEKQLLVVATCTTCLDREL